MNYYKTEYNTVDYKNRFNESKRIREKYPDKYPVIIQKAKNSILNDIDKYKFLIPYDLTIAQLINLIRKRIELKEYESLFIFVNNTLPSISSTIATVYEEEKSNDGFLYVTYNSESTFG